MPKVNNNDKKKVSTIKKKQRRRGTRNKYEYWLTKEGLTLLEGWARDGLIDEDIAKKMQIVPSTLYEWKKKYPKLSEALKNGKEVVDTLVENALLKRALGYEYEEVTEAESYNDENGVTTSTKKTVKHIVPDTTAQIFWLKNRRPDKWRNSDRIEISTDSETNNILQGIADQFKARRNDPALSKVDTLED